MDLNSVGNLLGSVTGKIERGGNVILKPLIGGT